MAEQTYDANKVAISRISSTMRSGGVPSNVADSRVPLARLTEPIKASAAVEAAMVADISELRKACTATISKPGWRLSASTQVARMNACADRAMRSGWRQPTQITQTS